LTILILSSTNPLGGKAPFVLRFVNNMATKFPKTRVILHVPARVSRSESINLPVNVILMEFNYAPRKLRRLSEQSIPDLIRSKSPTTLLIIPFVIFQFISLIRALMVYRPHVAISFWLLPQSFYISVINAFLKKHKPANWAIVAGSDLLMVEKIKSIMKIFYRFFPYPEIVCGLNKDLKARLLDLGFLPRSTIYENPLGFNAEIFAKPDLATHNLDNLAFIFVGRLEEQKDPLRALSIFKFIKSTHINARMTIVGEGRLLQRLHNETLRNGFGNDLVYIPSCTQEELSELFKNHHFLVIPSKFNEGSPTVIQEAMASGVIVIATQVGGIPELIKDGETGFLLGATEEDHLTLKAIFDSIRKWPDIISNASKASQKNSDSVAITFWTKKYDESLFYKA
jgi:glycosyltransferase involved in cell wall biosynthesis